MMRLLQVDPPGRDGRRRLAVIDAARAARFDARPPFASRVVPMRLAPAVVLDVRPGSSTAGGARADVTRERWAIRDDMAWWYQDRAYTRRTTGVIDAATGGFVRTAGREIAETDAGAVDEMLAAYLRGTAPGVYPLDAAPPRPNPAPATWREYYVPRGARLRVASPRRTWTAGADFLAWYGPDGADGDEVWQLVRSEWEGDVLMHGRLVWDGQKIGLETPDLDVWVDAGAATRSLAERPEVLRRLGVAGYQFYRALAARRAELELEGARPRVRAWTRRPRGGRRT